MNRGKRVNLPDLLHDIRTIIQPTITSKQLALPHR